MEKKKFLFVTQEAMTLDLAWTVAREGHEVRFYIGNREEADIGDGFVEKTDDWYQDEDWADTIVFEYVLHGQGAEAKRLREKGKLVVGGTPYTDELEESRSFGQNELRTMGVPILNYREFTDFDEAIAFVRSNPDRYVIKPSGKIQNQKNLTFVGIEDDGSDVIRVLEAYRRVWGDVMKVFQLQKKVTGVEVAVGAFFNGNRFLTPININFEHKRMFPGDIGPATDEMGTSMFWSRPTLLFNQTLKKFEEKLREEKYVGYIDLNCIVNSSGIYPLEFTARFGFPTILIQTDGIAMPMGELLFRMASGDDFEIKTKKGFQVGVHIVVPPYPYRDKLMFDAYSKNAVIVFKRPLNEGVHIEDVKLVNGEWTLAGSTGCALVVTGQGSTMKAAQQQAYARIQHILIPNMYYRKDIGDRWQDDSDRLRTWGYLWGGE